MRLIITAAAVLALAVQSGLGQERAVGEPVRPAGTSGEMVSLIVTEASAEDVGTVRVGGVARRVVEFQNRLDVPVEISVAEKSCGCLSAMLSKTRLASHEVTTLKMDVQVVATASPQYQIATLRVVWQDEMGEHAEKVVCGVRYQPNISYIVRPEAPAVVVVQGEEAVVDILARVVDIQTPPKIVEERCTLPGWRFAAIEPLENSEGVTRIRLAGSGNIPAVVDGIIVCSTESPVQPELQVRMRVRVLSAYRADPGGVLFCMDGDRASQTVRCRLSPRSDSAPTVQSVRVTSASRWISAALEDDWIVVRVLPGEDMPTAGATRVEVLADNGKVVLSMPVAWLPSRF